MKWSQPSTRSWRSSLSHFAAASETWFVSSPFAVESVSYMVWDSSSQMYSQLFSRGEKGRRMERELRGFIKSDWCLPQLLGSSAEKHHLEIWHRDFLIKTLCTMGLIRDLKYSRALPWPLKGRMGSSVASWQGLQNIQSIWKDYKNQQTSNPLAIRKLNVSGQSLVRQPLDVCSRSTDFSPPPFHWAVLGNLAPLSLPPSPPRYILSHLCRD